MNICILFSVWPPCSVQNLRRIFLNVKEASVKPDFAKYQFNSDFSWIIETVTSTVPCSTIKAPFPGMGFLWTK